MRDRLRAFGSVMRGMLSTSLCSKSDRIMREAIERLNAVSDLIDDPRSDRAMAVDDIADSR